tara:strand:+ start:2669 stop:3229 length:561 start_codon:yes stop_codon:yes gene_type:complete
MFKGFNTDKYKKMKPPSNNSFTTMQEIKELVSIPMNKSSVKKHDDFSPPFFDLMLKNRVFKNNNEAKSTFDLMNKLIKKSHPIIIKLKKHFNRPRPKVIAKKINIKLKDYEMDSMKTASYPSGHSAQGILVARILADKFPQIKKQLMQVGKRISDSRRVAKAHYKSDSKLGELIGEDMYNHIKNKV